MKISRADKAARIQGHNHNRAQIRVPAKCKVIWIEAGVCLPPTVLHSFWRVNSKFSQVIKYSSSIQ